MGQISDESGNIITRQGDTFYVYLTLEEDEAAQYGTLYLQVINDKRKMMFPEEIPTPVTPETTEIRIEVPAASSDLLVVPKNEDFAEYRYAVKHCTSTGVEDTWIIGGMEFDQLPTITVYPKIVNGGIGAAEPENEGE